MSDPVLTSSSRAASWLSSYLALALIWGSSFVFIKLGVAQLHPFHLALGRVTFGLLTLLVVVALTRTRLPRDPRVWGHLSVVAAFGVAIPFSLFGFGEQRISSVLAGIWNATTPLLVLPMAAFVFRTERMTARRAVGLVLGFAGVLGILGVWHGVGGAGLTGQLMCLGAAACYGIAIPYFKRFLASRPEGAAALSAGQLLLAALMLAAVSVLSSVPVPTSSALTPAVVGSVLALGVLGTGLAFVLNLRVIREAGASTSASVTYLLPVVATLIGVMLLDERLAWYQPVGALVVLLGVAISQGVTIRLPWVARMDRAGQPIAG